MQQYLFFCVQVEKYVLVLGQQLVNMKYDLHNAQTEIMARNGAE